MKPFLAAAFTILAAPVWAETEITTMTSPGGINAWLVQEPSIPFTALEIRFKGGASLDADGKRGAINLMTGLLEEGAGDLDAQGFATAREDLATTFAFDVYDDALTISAQFLTENRDESMDLLRLALMETTFDAPSIARVRGQVESIINSDLNDPNNIASEAFSAMAFGSHPYGTDLNGTLESIAGITRDDLVAARDAVIARDRLFVAAVGDITAEELGVLLDDLLGDLPAVGAPMPAVATYGATGGTTVIDFENPQSVAFFGHEGIARDDDDFFPAYVMNEILGGRGLGSRLNDEVREKRGLTYGISSFLAPKDRGALVLGSFASSNGTVAEAIDIVVGEWTKMAENGVTQDELDASKTYLTGAYPLRFDGNSTIANIMVGMQMTGLSPDYIRTRNDNINAVTRADIQRVAKRVLRPKDLRIIVVGQPVGVVETE